MKKSKSVKKVLIGMLLIVSVFLFLSTGVAYADTWAKTYNAGKYGERGCIQQTSDGGFIMAGGTSSFGAGLSDIFILKLDSIGHIQWQKTYGGYHYEHVEFIQQTSDGGYIILGDTTSFGSGQQALILKLDSSGNILWQKSYHDEDCYWYGCLFYHVYVSYIQQTIDGGYIITGHAESAGAFVIKLDAGGNIEWRKSYTPSHYWWLGSSGLGSIQQTPDGGYIASGAIQETSDVYGHAWVLKLDLSGNIQWQKTYVGFGGAFSIKLTSDGGYIVAGGTGEPCCSGWVLKLDSGGAVEWQKGYYSENSSYYISIFTIQQTADGGYMLSGRKSPTDRWLSKLDSLGNIQWQRTYPVGWGNIWSRQQAEQTIDGGYIALGKVPYTYEHLVLKFDSNGRIPVCSVISDAPNATVVNTNATVRDTTVVAEDINILPRTSNAVVGDINVTPRVLCMQTNQPPLANAGPAQTVSCAGPNGAAVTLDGSGSSDPDGDALTYTWTGVFGTAVGVRPTVQIPLGAYTITLKVDDGKGGTAQAAVTITVQDKVPPSTSATITGTSGNNGWYKSAVNVSLTSADNCSGVKEIHYILDGAETITPGSAANLTINADGRHSLSYWAVDNAGNIEQAKSVEIMIDKTPPVLNVAVTPGLLWPPNHKMVNITPLINVSDNLTSVKVELVSVVSSEPDNGLGDGDTPNDIVINPDGTILLRAERSGMGTGRVYTITYKATDLAGNVTVASATVVVPHDMRK